MAIFGQKYGKKYKNCSSLAGLEVTGKFVGGGVVGGVEHETTVSNSNALRWVLTKMAIIRDCILFWP